MINHKLIYTSKSKSYYKTSNISIFNELQLKTLKQIALEYKPTRT